MNSGMVCFHKDLSQTQKHEVENSSKKRRRDESQVLVETLDQKPYKTRNMFDMIKKSHRETPLPLEWQRCLDIKSGQLYFYNTRTQKRTTNDPRISSEPPSCMISLDLQLNLPYGRKHDAEDRKNSKISDDLCVDLHTDDYTNGLKRYPSWLTIEGDQREMVTAVCKKCHMLVIMCKSYPTCPNCKFVHPQN